MTPKRPLQAAVGAALMLPLVGCISVSPPDKPIEINLNVTIQQEVLVRMQRDVDALMSVARRLLDTPTQSLSSKTRKYRCIPQTRRLRRRSTEGLQSWNLKETG